MTVIKNDIGLNFLSITSNYNQVWANPKFSMNLVSRQGVAIGRAERTITDEVVKIMAFMKDVKFATADQIARGTGLDLGGALKTLESQHYLNHFVISDMLDPSEVRAQDALKIYTLDFAGVYLLSIEGYDMTKWRWTDHLVGISVIKKALIQTEIYVEMSRSAVVRIRNYEQFRSFRLGASENDVDFFVSLASQRDNAQVWNYAGFIVEAGDEDLFLRQKLQDLEAVFHETKAGLKYFPEGEPAFPKLFMVIESANARNLNAVKNVIGHVTTWSAADVAIVALDEIQEKGLSDATFYTIQTTKDEAGEKVIKLGKMTMPLFKRG